MRCKTETEKRKDKERRRRGRRQTERDTETSEGVKERTERVGSKPKLKKVTARSCFSSLAHDSLTALWALPQN